MKPQVRDLRLRSRAHEVSQIRPKLQTDCKRSKASGRTRASERLRPCPQPTWHSLAAARIEAPPRSAAVPEMRLECRLWGPQARPSGRRPASCLDACIVATRRVPNGLHREGSTRTSPTRSSPTQPAPTRGQISIGCKSSSATTTRTGCSAAAPLGRCWALSFGPGCERTLSTEKGNRVSIADHRIGTREEWQAAREQPA